MDKVIMRGQVVQGGGKNNDYSVFVSDLLHKYFKI